MDFSLFNRSLRFGATAFFIAAFSMAAAAEDLYVSTTGSDSNPGTQAAPFRSIQKAAGLATAGTTVHVAPGTYSGPIRTTSSGTASARIRFISDLKWGAKIIPGGSNYGWYDSGNYLEINGFEFDGQSGPSWRDGIVARGSYTLITNNHVHHIADKITCDNYGGSGINMGSYEYGVNQDVISNVIHDIGFLGCGYFHGIYAATSGNVKNNLVYKIGRWAIHLWHDSANINVVNNTVLGSSGGIVVGGGEYYHISGPTDNVHVHNNIVYDNDEGILEEGSIGSHNTFLNNLSFKNAQYDYNLINAHSGDINAEPQFVNYIRTGGGDYHLLSSSPAIDHGTASYAPSTDLEGRARPQGAGFDLGAYEFPAAAPAPSPTPADTTAPTTNITSPANGATIKRGTTVQISAIANDNVSVSKVEFYVNGVLKCTDTSASYSCLFSVSNRRGFQYRLQTKAYDPSGNVGLSPLITISTGR